MAMCHIDYFPINSVRAMMFFVLSRGTHMHLYRLWIAVWLIGLGPLVTGCGAGAEQVPNCGYISGNVLADPQFSALDAPRKERFWRYSQHPKISPLVMMRRTAL